MTLKNILEEEQKLTVTGELSGEEFHISLKGEVSAKDMHIKFGGDLFNEVWKLLEINNRTDEQNDEMVNAAHASLYHWSKVGKPKNIATGHWQISRVYSVLMLPEQAIYHAKKCLSICKDYKIPDNEFEISWAYEALANAYTAKAESVKIQEIITLEKTA